MHCMDIAHALRIKRIMQDQTDENDQQIVELVTTDAEFIGSAYTA